MRVVETCNYGGDYPDESFLTPKGTSTPRAEKIAQGMNAHLSGPYAQRYWKVVPDDYVLLPGFEP